MAIPAAFQSSWVVAVAAVVGHCWPGFSAREPAVERVVPLWCSETD